MKTLTIFFILIASMSIAQTKIKVQSYDSLDNSIAKFDDPILQPRLDCAVSLLEPLIYSNEFEKSFCKVTCLRKHGYSNCEILDKIRAGNRVKIINDAIINLKISFDFSPGLEDSRIDKNKIIHFNLRTVYYNDVEQLAARLLREYCHVLGFRNSPLKARLRVYTVPFRAESIVLKQLHEQQRRDRLADPQWTLAQR